MEHLNETMLSFWAYSQVFNDVSICVSEVRIIIQQNLIILTISAKNELLCLQAESIFSVIQHYQPSSVYSAHSCVWVAAAQLLET